MERLTKRGQDAPLVPRLQLDRPIFVDGKLVGVERLAKWLSWPAGPKRLGRILVVDDVKQTAYLMGRVLRLEGFDVARAYDGVSGLAAARALLPDLIVLNAGLPGLSGFEVLRALRTDAATRDIKVIITSKSAKAAEWAAALGAQDFLPLPCEPRTVLARVTKALSPEGA